MKSSPVSTPESIVKMIYDIYLAACRVWPVMRKLKMDADAEIWDVWKVIDKEIMANAAISQEIDNPGIQYFGGSERISDGFYQYEHVIVDHDYEQGGAKASINWLNLFPTGPVRTMFESYICWISQKLQCSFCDVNNDTEFLYEEILDYPLEPFLNEQFASGDIENRADYTEWIINHQSGDIARIKKLIRGRRYSDKKISKQVSELRDVLPDGIYRWLQDGIALMGEGYNAYSFDFVYDNIEYMDVEPLRFSNAIGFIWDDKDLVFQYVDEWASSRYNEGGLDSPINFSVHTKDRNDPFVPTDWPNRMFGWFRHAAEMTFPSIEHNARRIQSDFKSKGKAPTLSTSKTLLETLL